MTTSNIGEIDPVVCGRIWTSAVTRQALLRVCEDIGPHLAGSPGMAAAVDCVQAIMRDCGARRLWTEPVALSTWQRGDVALEVGGKTFDQAQVLQFLLTDPADVRGPLIDAGSGNAAQIKALGDAAAGAILLAREIHGPTSKRMPGEMSAAALEAGAVGAISIASETMGLPMSGMDRGMDRDTDGGTFPVFGVSRTLATCLSRAAAGRDTVRLVGDGHCVDGACRNIVAELGPEDAPIVIISAHLDGYDISPSASDNMTGICCMLEMLNALAPFEEQFKRRLRVIAFTGEELGFLGSRAYVEQHVDEHDDIMFQFNMDSLFDQTARGVAMFWCRPAIAYMQSLFADADRPVTVVDMLGMSSDYVPFELQGIPTARPAMLSGTFPTCHHTPGDTVDKVQPEEIKRNAMGFAQMVLRLLLTDEPFPATRLTRDEIIAEMQRWHCYEQWQSCGYLGMLRGQ
ncbi:MAG: M28 family peptidase [Lentisphaeria bacterium]|nr:M28 family peptidase [Lentisphaeria bacterium]MDP7741694.1 M28 family peptidase [Lentisphaeria bacterium]